jgi:hypothetical protein
MHDIDRTLTEFDTEADAFELEADGFEFDSEQELDGELGGDFESPFNEEQELAYAAELLSIASEEELDLFLGKLLKGAWRGIRTVGRAVGRVARPLGGILKSVAKKALPFVGGALGSLIPVPGVGTAVGTALGGALSKALETELEGMAPEERELEMARRFVRVAGAAAQQVASMPPDGDPVAAARQAVVKAAQRHVPALQGGAAANGAGATSDVRGRVRGRTGRWIRRGSKIVVMGV